jgi:hypothetical protein
VSRWWRTAGGVLAPPRRQGWWVAAGVLLEVVASAVLIYCMAKYGGRASLPHGVVGAIVAALVIELAGAVVLARALAPSRGALVVGVPFFYVWPALLVVLVGLWVATLGFGDPMLPLGGASGRYRESKRGRRRRQKLARERRSPD